MDGMDRMNGMNGMDRMNGMDGVDRMDRRHRMDRLPAVASVALSVAPSRAGMLACALAAGLALVACDSTAPPTAPPAVVPPLRTDLAKPAEAPAKAAAPAASPATFCELHATEAQATTFHWPALAAGSTAPAAPTTWRWVNLWATWCKPCIEEMPRLAAWRDRLAAAGKRVELTFVSIDDSDEEVEAYRKLHPETPPSIRISGAAERAAWLKTFGLDDGAIPIHLFVSATNRLRCARAGGIRDKDYAVIDQLLGQ
jgi:thiol-disulfide isomerase/thioredoxin